MLLYLLVEQQLPFEFSISDFFDALYFMSEERWNAFFDQFSFSVSKENPLFALMKSNDHERISEAIGLELEKIPWLQMDAKGIFHFLPTALF